MAGFSLAVMCGDCSHCRLLIAVAALCSGAWTQGCTAFSSCQTASPWFRLPGSRTQAQELWRMTCVILPGQGSNPCPPHLQADSILMSHLGSP